MTNADFTGAQWRKSSYSGSGNNDNCVTLAWSPNGSQVGYRNSKDPDESTLAFSVDAHRRFVAWAAGCSMD
jgi:hypothetical protein